MSTHTGTPARLQHPVELVERLADLIVGYGANVQEGQIVAVTSDLGKEQLTREVAAAAYRRGASFVEVTYNDPMLKRARVLNADPDTLEQYPSWFGHRTLELGEQRCARVSLTGPSDPHALEGLDPELVGREQSSARIEAMQVMNDRSTNWVGAPAPTPQWAELVYPDLDPEAALARLWDEIAHACRLDADDPIAAWHERMQQLQRASAALRERSFDALRFTGPGTDLTVGLLPTSRFLCAQFETASGLRHAPNVPSEEIFTSPDPARTEGVVRSTKPLVVGGAIIEGLQVEFRGGRVVRIDADQNADVLRAMVARDAGAARLGEVALVDGAGRIGPLGTVFYDTLLDENAASHIALGTGFDFAVEGDDLGRINRSAIHIDFMIGGPDVDVSGLDADGNETPVLIDGAWKI